MTTVYVAMLRAVNVGGTGKLLMAELKAMCDDAGFYCARTVLASGNAVFASHGIEADVRSALAARLERRAGRPVAVLVRTAEEVRGVLKRNPFADAAGDRTVALFTDLPCPDDPLEGATGLGCEQLATGVRELYIHYPRGQADARLRVPAMRDGTARNMNTVGRLAATAALLAASIRCGKTAAGPHGR
jgi:uncharacterized protein (DUF1697 family)